MKLYKQPGSKNWHASHMVSGKIYRKSMGSPAKREAEKRAREWANWLEEQFAAGREHASLSFAISTYISHCQDHRLARSTWQGYLERLRPFLKRTGDVDVSLWDTEQAISIVMDYLEYRLTECQMQSSKGDRLVLSGFFNFLRAKRWYRGENPAEAKLHNLRRPRRKLKAKRCTSKDEDLIFRREGPKVRLWPVLLLTRWAGMRRGEACKMKWSEIELAKGYADVIGHEGGRKHPRRVTLAPWIVMQLRAIQPGWLPEDRDWPVWPHHQDTASDDLVAFCGKHLTRSIGFNDLRASWVTEVFRRGMTPSEESQIAGHSPSVAAKHYSEYEAEEARDKLPPDPLWEAQSDVEEDCDEGENAAATS